MRGCLDNSNPNNKSPSYTTPKFLGVIQEKRPKGCLDNSNPNNKLPLYTTPNPFGIIKKIPKKIIPLIFKLTRLDRFAMEIILATITVPDEQLKSFIEKELVDLINKVGEPAQEAMNQLGSNMIEPLFRAIPFVNLTYVLGDIMKAVNATDEVKGKGAQALETIVGQARELYGDIQGPSRTLSSLILGIGNYIEQVQHKLDRGEPLTEKDLEAIRIYGEVGKDYDGPPSKETPKRATARVLATKLVEKMRAKEALTGLQDPDRELIKYTKKFLIGDGESTGAEQKELTTDPSRNLLYHLLEKYKDDSGNAPRGRKTRRSHRKNSSTRKRSRDRGSK